MPRKAKITPIQPPSTPIIPQLPPAPEPPNPVVLALQEQILGLVNQRGVEQEYLAKANAALRGAQASAESARERLQMVEGEVRYRLSLIAQLQGKPEPQYAHISEIADYPNPRENFATFSSAPQAGVGSIPPRRAPMAGVVGEVRSEDAEDVRRSI
jgi:hypothetical protein